MDKTIAPLVSVSLFAPPGAGQGVDPWTVYHQHVAPHDGPSAHAAAGEAVLKALGESGALEAGAGVGELFDLRHPGGVPWMGVAIHVAAEGSSSMTAIPFRRALGPREVREMAKVAGAAAKYALLDYVLPQVLRAAIEEDNRGR